MNHLAGAGPRRFKLGFGAVGKLQLASARQHQFLLAQADELVFQQGDLAGNRAKSHLAGIEQEHHPLVIAGLARRRIGRDEIPVASENVAQRVEQIEIVIDFLDRHEVEGRNEGGDIIERLQLAFAVASRALPPKSRRFHVASNSVVSESFEGTPAPPSAFGVRSHCSIARNRSMTRSAIAGFC